MTETRETKTLRGARFWDRIARRYARSPIKDEATYRKKLEMTQAHLRPEMAVLELGCGTGSTAIAHSPFVAEILATDISARMIEIARRKADEAGVSNVNFQQWGVDELDADGRQFDAVLALNVLHLIADWSGAIAKIHGLLKPGGLFVSSTACLGDFMAFIRYVAPLGRVVGLLPLVRVFKRSDLEQAMRNAGFAIEEAWQPARNKALFLVARKAG